ncbi:EsV-1-99 [Tribonema minus]|uniref:EsV-1-99 n=1 Tax=Tribonema minus TaxID=303371 RepID=A0A835ZM14_9STRA|nr:EsV-1-99 [Tribonema minus]
MTVTDSDTNSMTKRVMRPAISDMSVREERKALQEIRSMANPRPSDMLQCNGMSVAEFALRYTNGHHSKRLKKNQMKQEKKKVSPKCPFQSTS